MADSLVDQIFTQARAGSAEGASLAEPLYRGVAAAHEQQRINLASQQLAMSWARQQVENELSRQQAEMVGLKVNELRDTRNSTIDNEQVFQDLTGQVSRMMSDENSDPAEAEAAIWNAVGRNKGLWRHQGMKQLLEDVRAGVAAREQLASIKAARTAANFQPVATTVTNPVTGEVVPVLRTGPNTSSVMKPANESQSPLGKLIADRNAAMVRGDHAAVSDFDAEIELRKQKTGFQVTTNPDGSVTVTQGPLTQANQTQVQRELSANLRTIDTANRLEGLLDNETMGVQAFAESWLKDRILAQRFPELASSKRADAQTLATQLRASAIRELRSDSNISEKEREQIMQAVPSINDPVNSAANARRLVQGIRRMSAIHGIIAATKLNQPIPAPAALVLSAADLQDLVKSGILTEDQAIKAYDVRHAQR